MGNLPRLQSATLRRRIRRLRHIRQKFVSILVSLNLTPNQNHYLSHSFLSLCLLYLHTPHKNHIFNTSINTYFN
ncbi:hypothetical protein HH624_004445 [Escherichia coli]|nr:hypothetical protein [Escherichia coli]EFI9127495.1 hypothetical protein [Escherichia coli]NAQ96985.1 hypothetical protein [Escherichia coli]RNI83704.1 hypothetical protein EFV11_21530 [Escherichia coli]